MNFQVILIEMVLDQILINSVLFKMYLRIYNIFVRGFFKKKWLRLAITSDAKNYHSQDISGNARIRTPKICSN